MDADALRTASVDTLEAAAASAERTVRDAAGASVRAEAEAVRDDLRRELARRAVLQLWAWA